ncbi:MAG: hypothetical protein ABI906_03710 [Pseudomonadota bacterium]
MDVIDPFFGARAALLDHLPKELILERYRAAGGEELSSGKFLSPESSAALAANAFGVFAERPDLLTLPSPAVAPGEALSVQLETQMLFPWRGGLHPWLDVAIETKGSLIAVEAKRYEPFRDRKTCVFSEAYSRPVWGPAMRPFETMRDDLKAGSRFVFLDAAQLVKHAFGLRTEAERRKKRAVLCYLYAEPKSFPDGKPISPFETGAHRQELAAFAAAVSSTPSQVTFCSLPYSELLRHWLQKPTLRHHATALTARFDV